MKECLSGKSSYWGKSSAGMTYRGSYLQDRSTYMEGCREILRVVYLLFWSIFSSSEGTSSSRLWRSPRYPDSHIHVSTAPTSTAPAWWRWFTQDQNPNQFWLLQARLSFGLQTLSEEITAARKDAAKHTIQGQRIVTPPGQLSAARHRNNCHGIPFQKPSHLQNPRLQKK